MSNSNMIVISCGCKNGEVTIYNEFPIPPSVTICNKCNGTGTLKIKKSKIEKEIQDLKEQRDEIDKEIAELNKLLEKNN
jgi:hypothetical protein